MAFVNKQGGEERRNEIAGADDVIDFDPNDPTVVKVHYDLGGWSFDQRAQLAEELAEAGLPHAWDGDELVVPELVESQADAVFDRLEAELGPFPVTLEADAESTEFGLDEWSDADRSVLTQSLTESEIPFRWEGAKVVVARDAEDVVDDLLDAIEDGELLDAGDDSSGPPDGALSTIFLAADKLARDPLDARARTILLDIDAQIADGQPPYAFAPRTWSQAVGVVREIVALVRSDAAGQQGGNTEADGDALADHADRLRNLLRPYV